MTHISRTLIVLTALIVGLGSSPSELAVSPERSKELLSVVDDAVALFSGAQLWLPELDIYTHAAKADCGGASGVFNLDGSAHRVDLCTDRQCVLIHELAHAWLHHNTSESTRVQFVGLVGAVSWNDGTKPWRDRGVEMAAEAIAWGVATDPLPDEMHLYAGTIQQRFELLTGQTSPRLTAASAEFGSEEVVEQQTRLRATCDFERRARTAASDAT